MIWLELYIIIGIAVAACYFIKFMRDNSLSVQCRRFSYPVDAFLISCIFCGPFWPFSIWTLFIVDDVEQ